MQLGMLLHPERGMDAVLEEARVADQQGFDSVWVSDHLMDTRGQDGPDGPFDSFTLMTAVGAVTSRTRLAWAMLNPSFHFPAVLAKRLSTLDHITHGRVICTLGAVWFKAEYRAYNVPLVDDHDERIEHEREVIRLLKELWTHPAPAQSDVRRKVRAVHRPALQSVTVPAAASTHLDRRRLGRHAESGERVRRRLGHAHQWQPGNPATRN